MSDAARDVGQPSLASLASIFVELRWRLLRGGLRRGGGQAVTVVLGTIGAVTFGGIGGAAVAVVGLTADDPDPLLVIAPAAMLLVVLALGVIAGVAQPVDPRALAVEPLDDRRLGLGLLIATAAGPPGIGAGLVGLGLLAGAVRGPASIVPALAATAAFLATLLLASRTTINVLGLLVVRFPRAGQLLVGVVSLVFYGGFQFAPAAFAGLDDGGRRAVADAARLSPPGQLGAALATAGTSPLASLGHLVLGSLWLPVLAIVLLSTTRRLLVAAPDRASGGAAPSSGPIARLVRRACGDGASGAIAWRSLRTRVRHPRSALETVIGSAVGLAVVLVPAIASDVAGAPAVLVGVGVQLSVLFVGGNSLGVDGPALGTELVCGVQPEAIIAGKARALAVVGAPLVVVGPVAASAITGDWAFLPAGLLVGAGALLAGTGGAIVQSVLVPIAVPDSDNPLASGDSGRSLLAALVLAVVLVALAVATLPVGLGLLWALVSGSPLLTSALGLATVAAGAVVRHVSLRLAARRWRHREAEIFDAVVPAG